MTTFEVMAHVTLLEVAELGFQCSQIVADGFRCAGIATHTVHWPSALDYLGRAKEDPNCCDHHVHRWREVAGAMGIGNLQVTPLPVWRRPSDVDDSVQRFALMELT